MKWVGRGSGCTWPPPPHNLICPVVTPRHRSLFDTYNFTLVWRWIGVEWMKYPCKRNFDEHNIQRKGLLAWDACMQNHHQWAVWLA